MFSQGGGHGADALGFVAVEAGGLDVFFENFLGNVCVVGGGFVFAKKGFGDEVDAIVGALSGKDGGDEELDGVLEIEAAFGVGIGGFEDGEDGADAIEALLEFFGGRA